jgi:cytochrome c553
MKKIWRAWALGSFFCIQTLAAGGPDWSAGAIIPPGGRPNPFDLEGAAWAQAIEAGKVHAQVYPVEITGLLPPFTPLRNFLDSPADNPLRRLLQSAFQGVSGWRSLDQLESWMGMQPYPAAGEGGIYSVPLPPGKFPEQRLGFGLIHTPQGTGFSISCAECHASRLFGKTVLGLTNRFPRANLTFVRAKQAFGLVPAALFQAETGATDGETALYSRTRENLNAVDAKEPAALGLDTSLAQVALSLAHRNADPDATKSGWYERFPRAEPLAENVADSKPAVWWNVKYKDRWLCDGSVVSGNPIFTNILWNEIGRGTDLVQLRKWLEANQKKIEELASAVFASEAPRFTDFFPPEKISLASAQRGEGLFNQRCARCHGTYEKGWSAPDAGTRTPTQLLETTFVTYHGITPVVDVGTDPARRLGMKSLEQLNELAIAKENGVVVQAQPGYVPPPLVGIWARWPYLHNNSIPSLCALLTPAAERPAFFYTGEAENPTTDFDLKCNGYPTARVPAAWTQDPEHRYDTSREGMRNIGHDEGIFVQNGRNLLSDADRADLIAYLQTL